MSTVRTRRISHMETIPDEGLNQDEAQTAQEELASVDTAMHVSILKTPRKRGRPTRVDRTQRSESRRLLDKVAPDLVVSALMPAPYVPDPALKRHRGRPRKYAVPAAIAAMQEAHAKARAAAGESLPDAHDSILMGMKRATVPSVVVPYSRKTPLPPQVPMTQPSAPPKRYRRYEITSALRCHSRNNDPKDDFTTVWAAAFMPEGVSDGEYIAATAGGNNVCFIDCQRGRVQKKFTDPVTTEEFFSLAWTVLRSDLGTDVPVLAVGSKVGPIRLLDANQNACYHKLTPTPRKGTNALAFSPTDPLLLIAASGDGAILMWNIGVPEGAMYEAESFCVARFAPGSGMPTNALSWSADGSAFISGGNDRLISKWHCPTEYSSARKQQTITSPLQTFAIHNQVVDDLQWVNDTTVVSKAFEEHILLWEMAATPAAAARRSHKAAKKGDEDDTVSEEEPMVPPTRVAQKNMRATLQWPKPDVYFNKFHASQDASLIVAGTSSGSVNVYHVNNAKTAAAAAKPQAPSFVCANEMSTKMVRDVTLSNDGRFLVVVSDGNMIFVWEGK
eukprot:TRINITY_DN9936_c0_g1_i1.p1 TRINITY_DN9936_c0_g1~~TRINITY_DN9936_c0_g1_i1.p1  ORF type:complete len:560 (-),score=129.15 TRINITY_DN9936_c0_g1_i1:150-1829(-)